MRFRSCPCRCGRGSNPPKAITVVDGRVVTRGKTGLFSSISEVFFASDRFPAECTPIRTERHQSHPQRIFTIAAEMTFSPRDSRPRSEVLHPVIPSGIARLSEGSAVDSRDPLSAQHRVPQVPPLGTGEDVSPFHRGIVAQAIEAILQPQHARAGERTNSRAPLSSTASPLRPHPFVKTRQIKSVAIADYFRKIAKLEL